MIYLSDYSYFISERHHMLSGDNSLSELASDLTEFVRWQMRHSIKKKKEYDPKKYIYYYRWDYPEITGWFSENGKTFHYPVFLIENGSTVSVKISLGRIVKGRRKEREDSELIRLKGNERASHASKKLKGAGKNHVIYLNTYYLSNRKNKDVREFVMSDDFGKELAGTVGHEFTHAYDSYKIPESVRKRIDVMKKTYKKYRADNGIGKEWVTFANIGNWSGHRFEPDMEFLSKGNNLRTFLYMTLYYMTDTEMRAYIQTFYNQIMNSGGKDLYDSDIYKRYKTVYAVFGQDFGDDVVSRNLDGETIADLSAAYGIKAAEPSLIYKKLRSDICMKLDKYFKKLRKIFYDINILYK